MNTFKKNQIIITALAIMIAIAGYLNFTSKTDGKEDQDVFSNGAKDIAAMDATGLVPNEDNLLNVDVIQEIDDLAVDPLAVDAAVVDPLAVADPAAIDPAAADQAVVEDADLIVETAQIDDPESDAVGEAVFVNSTVDNGYFLKAKIDREQTRAYSLDILSEVINNENLAEEQKVEAAAEMIKLQDIVEKEAASESLLEAKGYSEVFVRMNETNVDVVVNVAELTATDLAQIADVVSRQTGIDPGQIVISPLKPQN